jgi:nucleoside-diphosphate-sugar epimerase
MVAVAPVTRQKHVIIGTGPVGAALARVLREAGRSVVAVPANEYGSDPLEATVIRGDATDFEFAVGVCEGAEIIYLCLTGPPGEWATDFPPVVENLIEVASVVGARLVHWDLAHVYGPPGTPLTTHSRIRRDLDPPTR